jgi:hypothetical protein
VENRVEKVEVLHWDVVGRDYVIILIIERPFPYCRPVPLKDFALSEYSLIR